MTLWPYRGQGEKGWSVDNTPNPAVRVDEITLVSLPTCPNPCDWPRVAWAEANRIGEAMGLIEHLGPMSPSPSALAGYTAGLDFGLHSFTAKGSFHEGRPASGVAVKLSAQALEHLCAVSGMHPREVLARALELEDGPHASRIDLAADFLDGGPTVQEINDGIARGDIAIFREQLDGLHKASNSTRSFSSDMGVQTLYIGKRVKNGRSVVRIYDKAAEQKAKKGPHLRLAMDASPWTRVELELHREYADQVAWAIAACADDASADAATAETIHSRCQCHRVDGDGRPLTDEEGRLTGELPWSRALSHPGAAPRLRAKRVQPLDLFQAYAYHATDSGLMALLDKVEGVWGDDAPRAVMEGLLDEHRDHVLSERTERWINDRVEEVRASHPDVASFLKEARTHVEARRNDAHRN